MDKSHPLNIPEIIYRIGGFVGYYDYQPKFYFSRPQLASALVVNRLWYQTLRPMFWSVFLSWIADDRESLQESIRRNSHYVRYAVLSWKEPQPAYNFVRLRYLDYTLEDPWAIMGIIKSNTQLQILKISIESFAIARSLGDILEPLKSLTLLSLSFEDKEKEVSATLDQIVLALSLLPNLQDLRVRDSYRILPPKMDHKLLPVLPKVTWLTIHSAFDAASPDLWLPLLCPKLESLRFWIEITEDELINTYTGNFDFELPSFFSDALQAACPALTAIAQNKHETEFKEWPIFCEDSQFDLMMSIKKLKKYKMVVAELSPILTLPLSMHVQTLEAIECIIQSTTSHNIFGLGFILQTFSKLKEFSVSIGMPHHIDLQDLDIVCDQPWQCLDLETFSWITPKRRPFFRNRNEKPENVKPKDLEDLMDKQGWVFQPNSDFNDIRKDATARAAVHMVMKRLFALPKLRSASFFGYDLKNGKYSF
ncbi:hypothetical protein BG004_001395 [Podila humilis]|nr:hypothetical protein BG004_001395 [Podila humilis]